MHCVSMQVPVYTHPVTYKLFCPYKDLISSCQYYLLLLNYIELPPFPFSMNLTIKKISTGSCFDICNTKWKKVENVKTQEFGGC